MLHHVIPNFDDLWSLRTRFSSDAGACEITLNRPAKLNALNLEMNLSSYQPLADLAFWFPIRGNGGNEHFYEFYNTNSKIRLRKASTSLSHFNFVSEVFWYTIQKQHTWSHGCQKETSARATTFGSKDSWPPRCLRSSWWESWEGAPGGCQMWWDCLRQLLRAAKGGKV